MREWKSPFSPALSATTSVRSSRWRPFTVRSVARTDPGKRRRNGPRFPGIGTPRIRPPTSVPGLLILRECVRGAVDFGRVGTRPVVRGTPAAGCWGRIRPFAPAGLLTSPRYRIDIRYREDPRQPPSPAARFSGRERLDAWASPAQFRRPARVLPRLIAPSPDFDLPGSAQEPLCRR